MYNDVIADKAIMYPLKTQLRSRHAGSGCTVGAYKTRIIRVVTTLPDACSGC
jgi:hypothetical protein